MKFETFEKRVVLDASLGPSVEFVIATPSSQNSNAPVPTDIQFRVVDDFRYDGQNLAPETLDAFIAATTDWAEDPIPIRTFALDDDDIWRKTLNFNPVSVHEDGYIIAERVQGDFDKHTMLGVQKPESLCHMVEGYYTRPDHHYRYSFDVRHPETELSWLETINGHWSIVSQIWGPDTAGPGGLNPPFSIHSSVQNGVPYWAISSRGDARVDIQRPYEEQRFHYIPMEDIGEWHRFDIEYVPNHLGDGLVRVWLNGEMVANWVDVQSSFLAYYNGEAFGPLNPSIGLYSGDAADGQEAHFDNFTLECHGVYESSISGAVTGTDSLAGNLVYATDLTTGERFGAETTRSGIYTLALPEGEYSLTAVDVVTGFQSHVDTVSTLTVSSTVVDFDLTPTSPPPPVVLHTLSADVTGDGIANVLSFDSEGIWRVSELNENGEVTSEVWTQWTNAEQWKDINTGDFNGDGLMDIAGRADSGSWWVAESNGNEFTNVNWGKWTPTIDWLHVAVGDFNGDGRSDIVGRAATNGSWWIATSAGNQFSNSNWGRWTTAVDWDVHVGDFNGDGLADVAGRASSDGTWWIGASNGTRFVNSYWGRFTNAVQWSEFQVGDFNGDGRTDLASRAISDGTWWVAESQGDRFLNRFFGRWTVNVQWDDVQIADVNGDGVSDIVARAMSDNSWWVAESTGAQFQNRYWGATWARDVDWLLAIADDFDGDGTADLLGSTPTSWLLTS